MSMIEVTGVQHAGGYKLTLWFSDGTSGTVDLSMRISPIVNTEIAPS